MTVGERLLTVLIKSTGYVETEGPRDRAGTFEPQMVKKRQRRATGAQTGRQVLRSNAVVAANLPRVTCSPQRPPGGRRFNDGRSKWR